MQRYCQCNYWISDAECVGTVNGFPVFNTSLEGGSGGGPVDPYLIGKDNIFRLEVNKLGKNPSIRFEVREMSEGDMADSTNLPDVEIPTEIPAVIEHRFDSEADHFNSILNTLKPTDPDEMIEFGVKLRDVFRNGDLDTVQKLHRPKTELIAAVMGAPVEVMEGSLGEMLSVFSGTDFSFEKDDLEALPHCEGRIWEVRRRNGKPLLHGDDPEGGGSISITIYAANTENGPAIVA